VIDEIDTRDGSLVSRVISDLLEPIVRVEVSVGARGHEYLLLLSASGEVRVWDIEGRFFIAAVSLVARRPRAASSAASAPGRFPPSTTAASSSTRARARRTSK
jgi:hypothetical protein